MSLFTQKHATDRLASPKGAIGIALVIGGLLLLLGCFSPAFGQFTSVGGSLGVDFDGNKDGGVAWGDFNSDGCLDLAFNTNSDVSSRRSRLFMGSCGGGFTDVTNTHATGLRNAKTERSIVWADLNNDGYLDLARNTWKRFEIYINQGPGGSPAYSLGTGTHGPNKVITSVANGMNVEGFGWIDYNGDGWLDLMLENHNFGIDIFQNPADGSANFFHVTPNGSTKGLPTGATTGDYMALTDYNNDGNVDILARKQNGMDLWTNNGPAAATQFTANTSFNMQAANGNKGGVLFADFDNDGDFDIFWSDNPACQIFENQGFNTGNFVPTGEPAASAFRGSFPSGANIDGCAAADVNQDGKMDLFLSDGSRTSYLLINTSTGPGSFSFTHNNMGINVNGDGEGVAFGDYDNDGDLDLYVNVNNGPNQLWRNDINNSNYMMVDVMRVFPGGIVRADIGATIIMKDCNGNIMSGIREVNGTRGHGSQDNCKIHFGLPNGPNDIYVLEIGFTNVGGVRETMQIAVQPNQHPNQEIVLTNVDPDDMGLCQALPVELVSFDAKPAETGVDLNWLTALEIDTDHFVIERSADGENFYPIGDVAAMGGSGMMAEYGHHDAHPVKGRNYYRLKEVTTNGAEYTYNVVEVNWDGESSLGLYPSLTTVGNSVNLAWTAAADREVNIQILDLKGQVAYQTSRSPEYGKMEMTLPTDKLAPGLWIVKVQQGNHFATQKLLLHR